VVETVFETAPQRFFLREKLGEAVRHRVQHEADGRWGYASYESPHERFHPVRRQRDQDVRAFVDRVHESVVQVRGP
jgi:hypothetical protein